MNKEELMKELLNRYQQRKSIESQDEKNRNDLTLLIINDYIEKLERNLKELL